MTLEISSEILKGRIFQPFWNDCLSLPEIRVSICYD